MNRDIPASIRIIKFNKWQESRTGADWEWWFGSAGEWFGMRVQAKRISNDFTAYERLDHLIGNDRERRQIDSLIQRAADSGLCPLYCFYNFWVASKAHWPCKTYEKTDELWGASVSDAYAVREKVDANLKDVSSVLPISMPLSCLVCCDGLSLKPDGSPASLPFRARAVANVLRAHTINQPKADIPAVTTELPPHVALGGSKTDVSNRDIAGILVVEERPRDVDAYRAAVLKG